MTESEVELSNKVSALEVHVTNNTSSIEKLEGSIRDLYEKLNTQNIDLHGVVFQFKNIIKEFTELSIDNKELNKKLDECVHNLEILKEDYTNKETICGTIEKNLKAMEVDNEERNKLCSGAHKEGSKDVIKEAIKFIRNKPTTFIVAVIIAAIGILLFLKIKNPALVFELVKF